MWICYSNILFLYVNMNLLVYELYKADTDLSQKVEW